MGEEEEEEVKKRGKRGEEAEFEVQRKREEPRAFFFTKKG